MIVIATQSSRGSATDHKNIAHGYQETVREQLMIPEEAEEESTIRETNRKEYSDDAIHYLEIRRWQHIPLHLKQYGMVARSRMLSIQYQTVEMMTSNHTSSNDM